MSCFFQILVPHCWWEVKPEFIHSLEFQKDIPNKRNALNHTDNSPCQKLATKIKAFQSAFDKSLSFLAVHLIGLCRSHIATAFLWYG